jgi:hypothetical protein
MRTAAFVVAAALAVGGLVVAYGLWSVGYCGALTPDTAPAGTLRHDLCRGASGDLMSTLVFVAWLAGAVAPLLALRAAERRGSARMLAGLSALGAIPIVTIAVLAEVLPRG